MLTEAYREAAGRVPTFPTVRPIDGLTNGGGLEVEPRSQNQAILEARIETLEAELNAAKCNVKQCIRDRVALEARIETLKERKSRLKNKLDERESELNVLKKVKTYLIETEEHRNLLLRAIEESSTELTLVSPWIDPDVFDDDVLLLLGDAIGRGTKVRLPGEWE